MIPVYLVCLLCSARGATGTLTTLHEYIPIAQLLSAVNNYQAKDALIQNTVLLAQTLKQIPELGIRHRASGTVGVWCLVVLAHVQIPSLFRKSFRKTRVFLQETLTLSRPGNSENPEMRSRAGGNPSTLPRGPKVSKTCAIAHQPTVKSPPGIPQKKKSWRFAVWTWVVSRTPSKSPWRSTWSPQGTPRDPNESKSDLKSSSK